MSSVSDLIAKAPISSISRFAGRPIRTPAASRSMRMNSSFGIGFGDATLMAPLISAWSIIQ